MFPYIRYFFLLLVSYISYLIWLNHPLFKIQPDWIQTKDFDPSCWFLHYHYSNMNFNDQRCLMHKEVEKWKNAMSRQLRRAIQYSSQKTLTKWKSQVGSCKGFWTPDLLVESKVSFTIQTSPLAAKYFLSCINRGKYCNFCKA